MAIIESYQPRLLYKYRQIDCENTKRMLSAGEIYFASPEILNDPCENFFMFAEGDYHILSSEEVKILGLSDTCIKNRSKNGNLCLLTPEDKTKYFMNSINKGNTRGIFSLSASNDIMQMYAYYANGSKDICIGFEWDKFGLMFDGSCPPHSNIPRRINYVSEPLLIKKWGSPDDWLCVFTTKGDCFSFEKEWRMFYISGKFSSDKVRQAIRSITFGPLFFNQERKVWQKSLKKVIKLTNGLNIEWFKTETVLGRYKLEVKPFDYHHYL